MPTSEEDVLVAALLWLKDEPLDNRLVDVIFGRYADRSGCWWNLRFQRDVKNGAVEDSRQDDEKRIELIVMAWSKFRLADLGIG